LDLLRKRARAGGAPTAREASSRAEEEEEEGGYQPLAAPQLGRHDGLPALQKDRAERRHDAAALPRDAHREPGEHINFFRDAERGKGRGGKRPESKDGGKGDGRDLTPYLGQSVFKSRGGGPW